MNIRNFTFGNTLCNQLCLYIVIDTKVAFFFKGFSLSCGLFLTFTVRLLSIGRVLVRYTQIAENNLCQLIFRSFRVNANNVINTLIEFCILVILKGRVNQTRVKS